MKKRKDGRWQKLITINGKRIAFYSNAETEKKAEKDIQTQLINYEEKEEKGKTIDEVITEWLKTPRVQSLTDRTYNEYKILLKRIYDNFKGKFIKEIKAEDIQIMFDEMKQQMYKTKTIRNQHSVMGLIFKFALIKRYINNNVMELIQIPKGEASTKRRALTDEEIKTINEHAKEDYGFLPFFLLYTGLRKSEALALRFSDINRKEKEITINKAITYLNNQPQIKTTKTESGNRTIPIPSILISKIPKGKKDEYLFHNQDNANSPLTDRGYDRKWEKFQKKTGLTEVTAHMLRHTYATLLFEADIDVKDAQSLLGHADFTTTNNIYTHIREKRKKETENKLNQFLNSKN